MPDAVEVTVLAPDRWGRNPLPVTLWVEPRHEEKLRTFYARVLRRGRTFLYWIGFAVAGMIVGMPLAALLSGSDAVALVCGAFVVLQGVVITLMPFSTPETVAMLGAGRAARFARGLGLFTIALGIGVAALAFV